MTEANNSGMFIFNQKTQERVTSNVHSPSKPFNRIPVIEGADSSYVPTSLYEYGMGIKNIQAGYATYPDSEVFVTKPIQLKENVMEIELESTEEHPLFDGLSGEALDRRTSVEYYISYTEKPRPADWLPILPRNQETIQGERLFLNKQRATLRFPSEMSSLKIYEDGLLLDKSVYLLMNNQEVSLPNAQSGNIYTASYTPEYHLDNPWKVQLGNHRESVQEVTEVFEQGTDINKTVTLSHAPYVDLQRIISEADYNPNTSAYRPIKVRLTDASIQGKNQTIKKLIEPYRPELIDEAFTYNKTLYLDKSWSQLKAYNVDGQNYYGGFDYYHHKNKLTFTEHFDVKQLRENLPHTHGNANIEITYDALITQFRLKIILRRNTTTEVTATPKVNDYQLHFKTIS